MTVLMLAILVGVLFTSGTLLILQRGQIKVVLGLALYTHAVNLTLFSTGELTHGAPAIIPHEGDLAQILASQVFADPLPQALVLTAIVISFGMTAVILIMAIGGNLAAGHDRIDLGQDPRDDA